MKSALILGVSGQDGAYLARLLLGRGYAVHGTTRSASGVRQRMERLGLSDQVQIAEVHTTRFDELQAIVSRLRPDEIYNLAGESRVALSFSTPLEVVTGIVMGTANLLEAVRQASPRSRVYNACSSECFGNTGPEGANESTLFNPQSPYGVAKASTFMLVKNYRETFGLFACSGLAFNHESPLRIDHFVTRKIVRAAVRLASDGSGAKLRLGDIGVMRDWGWAPDYVEAMWLMLQQAAAEDYVLGTGQCHSLEEFVDRAFDTVGLNWRDYVEIDATFFRSTDIRFSKADPRKAKAELPWQARHSFSQVVELMIEAEKEISS